MALNIVNIELDSTGTTVEDIKDFLFLNCDLVLAVSDISSPNALNSIKKLLPLMNQERILLIINKVDSQTKLLLTDKDIFDFKNDYSQISIFEITAMNKENTNKLFNQMYDLLYSSVISKIYHTVSYHDNGIELIDCSTMKVCLLGNSAVGKTALTKRYFNNFFHEGMTTTIGMDVQKRIIAINDTMYRFEVWDTAGQNQFRKIPQKHFNKVDGFLIIFDVTNRTSFQAMIEWAKDIKEEAQPNALVYLIGNKIDKRHERKVTVQEGEELAKELGIKYYEISCKFGLNIMEVMTNMVTDLFKKMENVNSSFMLHPQTYYKQKEKFQNGKADGCC